MRIALVHQEVPPDAPEDERDVLHEARAVSEGLASLGHECVVLPVGLDLADLVRRLRRERPQIVFNLVESLAGQGRLIHIVPSLLDSLAIPYTGNGADASYVTSNKLLGKTLLRSLDLPTPDAFTGVELSRRAVTFRPGRYIIKSVWEHASVGLDEDSLIDARSPADLATALAARLERLGGEGFAEAYVEGREFNLSLLGDGDGGCQVLPPAEIIFEGYGPDKPRIVGYRAKWDASSYEFHHTPRRFDFAPEDASLLTTVSELATRTWVGLGLRGYARVDFRVDEQGVPWILEVNTNPCLSPDAGFAAACARAGLQSTEVIARILADVPARDGAAVAPKSGNETPPSAGRGSGRAWRTEVGASDMDAVRRIVSSTGFFNPAEIDIAVELVEERLAKGEESGYAFVFLEEGGTCTGYACFGPIAGTQESYDLFWIAVDDASRSHGRGRAILERAEAAILAAGGRRIYVETSGRPQYEPTRKFYTRCGYEVASRLTDFYAPGDDKVTFIKVVVPAPVPVS